MANKWGKMVNKMHHAGQHNLCDNIILIFNWDYR